jgi:hypothetical protein
MLPEIEAPVTVLQVDPFHPLIPVGCQCRCAESAIRLSQWNWHFIDIMNCIILWLPYVLSLFIMSKVVLSEPTIILYQPMYVESCGIIRLSNGIRSILINMEAGIIMLMDDGGNEIIVSESVQHGTTVVSIALR